MSGSVRSSIRAAIKDPPATSSADRSPRQELLVPDTADLPADLPASTVAPAAARAASLGLLLSLLSCGPTWPAASTTTSESRRFLLLGFGGEVRFK
mmetsp:Transcript_57072/g.183394  ORF Transcript_57072/g.183394 Transcript_57072/m.183394 type:complete len:96 (-) Transcript_57072:843-1130(-)